MDEIINKVSNSKLITIDLEDYFKKGERVVFDISPWLYEGIILKEKEFRKYTDDFDWSQFKDKYVALTCKTDAILPAWAFLLVSVKLNPFVEKVVVGNLEQLETSIYQDFINNFDFSTYNNKLTIVKGCSKKLIPTSVFVQFISKLQNEAKSIMFGEACSSVPLFKAKKT